MAAPSGWKIFMKYLFISAVFLVYLQSVNCERTLELVHIVYRHGDRSPIQAYPTDNHTEDAWPQGFGQLSHIGEQQHYRLGRYFNQRYVQQNKLLNATYQRQEIVVTSTDVDRTLMSAYSNLAGLYPPADHYHIMPNISWQPIPVHTKPVETDNLLNTDVPCPRADLAYKQALNSPWIQQEESDNKRFYDFLSNKSGIPHENISHVWTIYDTLFCEKQHNLSLPDWVNTPFRNKTVLEKLATLESLEFDLKFGGPWEGKLRGGNLLGQVVQHMKDVSTGTDISTGSAEQDYPKLFMYSAHDTTVAAFLSAMQVFNRIPPPYTASVMVELFKEEDGNYSVEVFYQNTTAEKEAYSLTLPHCTQVCPLDTFIKITQPFIPTDWNAECQLPKSHFSERTIIGIGTAVGAIFIIILVVGITVWFRRRQSPPDGYFGIQQHA